MSVSLPLNGYSIKDYARQENGTDNLTRKGNYAGCILFNVGKSIKKVNHIPLYFADSQAYTIGINKAYEDLTGITQDQVLGKNLKELENTVFRPSVTLKVLSEGKPVTVAQKILINNRSLIVTGNPIYSQNGKIELVVTVAKPILSSADENITAEKEILFGEMMVVASPVMQQVINRAVRIASLDSNVMITGESGCGKELIARAIHDLSKRKNQPFISVNAASLPEGLFESELFGYVDGAFTGARHAGSRGLVRAAHGGTLFLDEISEMSTNAQVKLLRLLENKEIIPVGSSRVETVDVRILTATNQDLSELMSCGKFRQDLYYRISALEIYIPPLREREEDIAALAQYFVQDLNKRYKMGKKLHPASFLSLQSYAWPGNVRELKNLIERLALLYGDDLITPKEVESELSALGGRPRCDLLAGISDSESLFEAVDRYEKNMISGALKKHKSIYAAAETLGLHRTTLLRKMKKHGLAR
jgi:transcriptional regulator with PAS, ATPase and Fis domain